MRGGEVLQQDQRSLVADRFAAEQKPSRLPETYEEPG
jgi:hypothetical protein